MKRSCPESADTIAVGGISPSIAPDRRLEKSYGEGEMVAFPVGRYGLALVAFAFPLLLSLLLRRLHLTFNLTWILIGALMIAAWYGGAGQVC